jgi:hypothetical protein
MLESWNDGIMGFGKMGHWDIDNTFLDEEVKSINKWKNTFQSPIPLKTGSSTFQYSIIPLFHA